MVGRPWRMPMSPLLALATRTALTALQMPRSDLPFPEFRPPAGRRAHLLGDEAGAGGSARGAGVMTTDKRRLSREPPTRALLGQQLWKPRRDLSIAVEKDEERKRDDARADRDRAYVAPMWDEQTGPPQRLPPASKGQ
jgi:hypothetical protein